MFALAFIIGIYSYLIFVLGIVGLLYKNTIFLVSFLYLLTFLYYKRVNVKNIFKFNYQKLFSTFVSSFKENKLAAFFTLLIIFQIIINFIGVLGPEHAFDALWYHLTLPKLYLLNHKIEYIPGGLLYYSTMPQLTEMLYTSALAFNGEILAKFIHFIFGISSVVVLYKLSRKFLSPTLSLLAAVIFYSNLVVAWESITAYIDLARTFFEISALLAFVNWLEEKEKKWFILSAILVGYAISAKLIALGSLFIFTVLILYVFYKSKTKNYKSIIANILIYCFVSILVVSPWLIYSLLNTGNPVYPFFTDIYPTNFDISLLNPIRFFSDLWTIFTHADDPISPIYIIVLPLLLLIYRKVHFRSKPVIIYSILSIFIWYITPQTGGGRFILPYLPVLSLVVVIVIDSIFKESKLIKNILIVTVIIIAVSSILYRGIANARYIPVIIGKETKELFLSKHLNFSFGDFYDTDEYFKNHITPSDRILLFGFHNLYYVNFPFIDFSWLKEGESFDYIAVQNSDLPKIFKGWNLIYLNSLTKVKLYNRKRA